MRCIAAHKETDLLRCAWNLEIGKNDVIKIWNSREKKKVSLWTFYENCKKKGKSTQRIYYGYTVCREKSMRVAIKYSSMEENVPTYGAKTWG